MAQLKKQSISPEANPNEMEINELSDKGLKIILIKMLYELKKTVHEQNENINNEMELIKKNQTEILELKNTITELTNALEGFYSRLIMKKKNQQT